MTWSDTDGQEVLVQEYLYEVVIEGHWLPCSFGCRGCDDVLDDDVLDR